MERTRTHNLAVGSVCKLRAETLPTQPPRHPMWPVYSDTTQLNSTRQREQQLTQFVGHDVINKNTTDLAVRCSTGSVELSWVQLGWVELCRYKHPFTQGRHYGWKVAGGGAKNWVVGGVSHPAGGGSPEIYLFVIKLEISGFCAYSLQSGGDDNKIVTTENVLHANLCFLRKINYRYGCH